MHVDSKFLDDLSKVAGGALGAASGMKSEVEAQFRRHIERVMMDLDLVSREEFEAVSAMARKARLEQDALREEIESLKAELAALKESK